MALDWELPPGILVGDIVFVRHPGWSEVRESHLLKEPCCQVCGTTLFLEVHHEFPVHLFPQYELDPTKLITLCGERANACHRIWGHHYDFKKWNPYLRKNIIYWKKCLRKATDVRPSFTS